LRFATHTYLNVEVASVVELATHMKLTGGIWDVL
jgi:hypothetical protein